MFPPLSPNGHTSYNQLGTFQAMFTRIFPHSGLKDSYETSEVGMMVYHVREARAEIQS